MNIPILLIIYNRPKVLKKQLNALAKIKPKNLYVFCDGFKNEKDKLLVDETRFLINNLTWDCKIKTNFKKNNLGCKKGVESAIDWFFKNVEQGIILEDDCVPNKHFFKFSTELLDLYKLDNRISIITGFNAGNSVPNYEYSYYYSMYGGVWGWASWADRWQEYRKTNIKKLFNDQSLINSLIKKGISKSYLKYVSLSLTGKLDTWDYLWSFYNMSQNKLTIVPQKNLIQNIGFGEDATHTKIVSDLSKIKHQNIKSEIKHPLSMLPNFKIDNKRKLNHNKIYQAYRIIKNILIK